MTSLWLGILVLLLIAIGFIASAACKKIFTLVLSSCVIIFALFLYHYLGNAQGLRNAILLQAFNHQQDVLPELVQGLQKQLNHHPDDPITLYLLAKLYFSLGDYSKAASIFAQSHALVPDDPEILIDYVSAEYLANDGVISLKLDLLLTKIKKLPPTLESLSLLANVALATGDTEQAISDWQAMQAMVPKDSELYQELMLTIEYVQQP